MNLGIKGKKAIITGASKGLGKSIALSLLDEGVEVIAISRTGIDYDAQHIKCDLTKEIPNVSDLDIDIIINNLGRDINTGKKICSIEEWRRQFEISLSIPIQLNNQVIPYMKRNGWGRIINISSLSSLGGGGASDSYSSIKAALNIYTKKLGKSLAKYGIVVSSVMPGGMIHLDSGWEEFKINRPEEYKKYIEDNIPIGRLSKPEEVASVVVFLCSELASYCVGTIVPVTGGKGY